MVSTSTNLIQHISDPSNVLSRISLVPFRNQLRHSQLGTVYQKDLFGIVWYCIVVAIPNPGDGQFTNEELNIILDALVFTVNCLHGDRQEVQLYSKTKLVLAKVEGLLKQVETATQHAQIKIHHQDMIKVLITLRISRYDRKSAGTGKGIGR